MGLLDQLELADVDVKGQVERYFKRIKSGKENLPVYDRNEQGLYRIVGGILIGNERIPINYEVTGTFEQAVAVAVQLPEFYSFIDVRTHENAGSERSGYIEKSSAIFINPHH